MQPRVWRHSVRKIVFERHARTTLRVVHSSVVARLLSSSRHAARNGPVYMLGWLVEAARDPSTCSRPASWPARKAATATTTKSTRIAQPARMAAALSAGGLS